MLPWIRVPNTKSVSRMWSSHGHGSTKKSDLSSRSSGCETWLGSALVPSSPGGLSPHSSRRSASMSWPMYSKFG